MAKKKDIPVVPDEIVQPQQVLAKPFLKWAGGKGQLLPAFRELYPQALKEHTIKAYFEPFLGSGAVFFDIVQQYKIERAYLYDINEELILTYKVIQQDVEKLIEVLWAHQAAYLPLDKVGRSEYYYQQRADYNQQRTFVDHSHYSEQWIRRAAQVILLNKTCFNGLFRVNARGEFNTPAGDYTNPTICDAQNLRAVSSLLQHATLKVADFRTVSEEITQDSFVYFDPPYRPLSKTASFRAYSKHDFGDAEQRALAALYRQLSEKGALLMLSNSDPQHVDPTDYFFDELYKGFNTVRVPARRMINSDATKRGKINEIVITNYDTHHE